MKTSMRQYLAAIGPLLILCLAAAALAQQPPKIKTVDDGEGEEPAAASKEDVTAVKLDRVTGAGGGWGLNVAAGYEFETTAAVRITELGIWDTEGNGLDTDIPIAVWDADGKKVASATLPKGAGAKLDDQFRYVKIEPVELKAGQRYSIAVLYTPKNKDGLIGAAGASVSLAAPLRFVRTRYQLSEDLALPKGDKDPPAGELPIPGNFGPNFKIAPSAATAAARNYHRVRYLPEQKKYEVIVVPEKADGSHKLDKKMAISLYATPDGKLSQILFGDQALGAGDAGFTALAKEVKKLRESKDADKPLIRLAAMPQVPAKDRRTLVNVFERGEFDPKDEGRELRDGEVGSFEHTVKQPERGGKYAVADRFRDFGTYVEDRWTGLLWQKDGSEAGKMNHPDAVDYSARLELGGKKGWRLPTVDELATIFPANFAPFTATRYNSKQCCGGGEEFANYWTSQIEPQTRDYAILYQWYAEGGGNNCLASRNFAYIRCVRDPLK